ncbi:hypothetical protein F444_03014 [Phytophthora nicotianae P1976]|uniref:Uncharacterized protein n=1 Tax=Phytophthora nicotianae P1976 TaxID=1317066 RepID=A0A081AVI0_PHYNI|nr:hypothetical protein F444_03014 [Phytophthora nicotianae P1976]
MAARAERVIKERLELLEIKDEESGSLRCVFVLEPMIAEFTNLALRVDMIETISALLSDNVRLSRLSLNLRIDRKLKTDKLLAKMSFGRLVRSVFDHTRRSPELSNTQYCTEGKSLQVGTVVMHCDTSLTSLEFEALCSAMVTNQTTKRLLLSLWLDPKDANTSTTRWKWLAYALFSKRARACSALESLTLTSIGSMSIADMEAFVSVMTSKHPEEELFGTCGQINGRNATFEHSITNFRLDEAGESLELDVPTSVRTISDDGQSERVNGIIPGYGRCLFRRDDLIFQPSCEEYHSGIASLTIGFKGFNAQAVGGLGAFISAVGPPLRFLALDATRVNFDANFIVQCCPNLEELSLRSLVTDVRFDFTECQPLPTLRTDWTDSIAISTVLQDSCSPFTKYLRRLRVRLNNVRDEREVHDDVRINASVAGMLQMLEVNQTLEYLDVIAPLEYRGFLDKFKAHHLKPICRSTPFPVRSKIALLSIFSCHNDVHNQSKATYVPFDLDQHILHGIFQYAAPPILREVYFWGLDWIDKYNEVPI